MHVLYILIANKIGLVLENLNQLHALIMPTLLGEAQVSFW